MTLPNWQKVETSIVVLSGVDTSINIDGQELATILREPTGRALGDPPGQIEITSVRDQVVITLVSGRFIFVDKSDDAPGTGRLPEIVHNFLGLLHKQQVDRFLAYGFNFAVEFDSRDDEPPARVTSQRFLRGDEFLRRGNIEVAGAGLRLYFRHSDALCDMTVEPRLGQLESPKFFARINYHFDLPEASMPPLEVLKTKYLGLWPQFTEHLERLFVQG